MEETHERGDNCSDLLRGFLICGTETFVIEKDGLEDALLHKDSFALKLICIPTLSEEFFLYFHELACNHWNQ
jgi:hypothetical protein